MHHLHHADRAHHGGRSAGRPAVPAEFAGSQTISRSAAPRPTAPAARLATALLTVLLCSAACTSTDSLPPTSTDSARTTAVAATPTPSTTDDRSTAGQPTNERLTVTTIRITVNGRTLPAQLVDNPTARDLVDQLPLTLSFRDLNRVEKIAKLPRPLTVDGAPPGADPDINDIGYYAPSGDLVFYYGDVGYWNGIVRIGRFDDDGDLDFVERQPDGFDVTIERA